MAFVQASPRTVSILKWTAIGLAVFLIAILVLVSLVDWKGPIERLASARLHRSVEITGDVEVHPWSWSPGSPPQVSGSGTHPGTRSRRR
jgi:uncharacterized protein involved in outer membrane biogenesis